MNKKHLLIAIFFSSLFLSHCKAHKPNLSEPETTENVSINSNTTGLNLIGQNSLKKLFELKSSELPAIPIREFSSQRNGQAVQFKSITLGTETLWVLRFSDGTYATSFAPPREPYTIFDQDIDRTIAGPVKTAFPDTKTVLFLKTVMSKAPDHFQDELGIDHYLQKSHHTPRVSMHLHEKVEGPSPESNFDVQFSRDEMSAIDSSNEKKAIPKDVCRKVNKARQILASQKKKRLEIEIEGHGNVDVPLIMGEGDETPQPPEGKTQLQSYAHTVKQILGNLEPEDIHVTFNVCYAGVCHRRSESVEQRVLSGFHEEYPQAHLQSFAATVSANLQGWPASPMVRDISISNGMVSIKEVPAQSVLGAFVVTEMGSEGTSRKISFIPDSEGTKYELIQSPALIRLADARGRIMDDILINEEEKGALPLSEVEHVYQDRNREAAPVTPKEELAKEYAQLMEIEKIMLALIQGKISEELALKNAESIVLWKPSKPLVIYSAPAKSKVRIPINEEYYKAKEAGVVVDSLLHFGKGLR